MPRQHSCRAICKISYRPLYYNLDESRMKFQSNLNNDGKIIREMGSWIGSNEAEGTAPSRILTHWGRVTHICVGKLTIIGSDNGLSPGRRQAIIWTNAGILLIGPLGTNFSEILIPIEAFSFKKMHLKISSAKWHPFCLGLDVLTITCTNDDPIHWCTCASLELLFHRLSFAFLDVFYQHSLYEIKEWMINYNSTSASQSDAKWKIFVN